MAGSIEFDFNFNSQTQNLIKNKYGLMRVYMMGDFSLQAESANRNTTITAIDIDNFDEVMDRVKPTIQVNAECIFSFTELEDFHPDNIYQNCSAFDNLKRLKKELSNPQTCQQAADEIRASYQTAPEKSIQENQLSQEDTLNTIERLLGQPPSDAIKTQKNSPLLERILNDTIKPHLLAEPSSESQQLIGFIDSIIEGLMQSILHSPDFQELESIWRSTFDLLFNEETDENQLFYLVDIDKQSLFDELNQTENHQSSIVQKLVNTGIQDVDGQPYTLLIGNYEFAATENEIHFLNLIAEFAKQFNSSFIAAADKSFIKSHILAEQPENQLWNNFRNSGSSEWIALAYPRILLRVPYGKGFEETDCFRFEEFREIHEHEQLLWGNSAFACARLLIRQYLNPQFGGNYEITDLPAYHYTKEGEQILQACAEELFNEPFINNIFAHGIIPLISFRNRNSVRITGFQSCSNKSG